MAWRTVWFAMGMAMSMEMATAIAMDLPMDAASGCSIIRSFIPTWYCRCPALGRAVPISGSTRRMDTEMRMATAITMAMETATAVIRMEMEMVMPLVWRPNKRRPG